MKSVSLPATREVYGAGTNGTGIHMFRCPTCPHGSVAYDGNGKRGDHVLLTENHNGKVSFALTTYCEPRHRAIQSPVIVTGEDYNDTYSRAIHSAAGTVQPVTTADRLNKLISQYQRGLITTREFLAETARIHSMVD